MSQEWSPNSAPAPASEDAWVAQLRPLVDEGQCFLAYDYAQEALRQFPDSRRIHLLAALSLVRSGAVDEGRKLLAPLKAHLDSRESLARNVLATARQLLPTLDANSDDTAAIRALARLATDLVKLGNVEHADSAEDHETLQLLAQVFFETWRAGGADNDLTRSRNTYLHTFHAFDDRASGIDAALTSWLAGDRETAAEVAAQLLQQSPDPDLEPDLETRFRHWTARGELQLLRGAPDLALEAYRRAGELSEVHYPPVVAARERLELLQHRGLEVADEVFERLRPPVVVVFAGQPLDASGQQEEVFPAHLEDAVKAEIRQRLETLGADIGYCSGASGSDLLFIEAMLERDGEVHVFLPCAIEDFVETRVAYAGRRWEQRFRTALKLATTVSFATEEHYLGHDILFRFNNQVIDGMARLRAALLGTRPYLVLVWDYAAANSAGTAADFMDHWADIARLRLIDLDAVRSASPAPSTMPDSDTPRPAPQWPEGPERVIRSMLFADIVGFSKLAEEELPRLWEFLSDLKRVTDARCRAPDLVESWGDALYVAMPTAREILSYAFAVQEAFESMSAQQYGMSSPLRLRVGLHAGPVYEGVHPLTGKPIIYGSHVSRTARIEPVTVPGQIYGSQQFVAMLTAEESELRNEHEMTGKHYQPWFACEYLGNQPLAKKYGRQPVYLLRPLATGSN